MIALVFAILKHSLQSRGQFYLYFGAVPEFILVNSAARWFEMAVGFEANFYPALFLLIFADAFIDHIW